MEELIQKLGEQMEAMNGALEKGFAESKEVQEGLAERLREVERTSRSQSETVERPNKGSNASPAKSSTPSTMTTTSNTLTRHGRTSRKSFLAEQHELFSIAEQEQDLGEQNDEEVDETTQIRVTRYVSNIARNIGGHTGQEDDHASWVDTLVSDRGICAGRYASFRADGGFSFSSWLQTALYVTVSRSNSREFVALASNCVISHHKSCRGIREDLRS